MDGPDRGSGKGRSETTPSSLVGYGGQRESETGRGPERTRFRSSFGNHLFLLCLSLPTGDVVT